MNSFSTNKIFEINFSESNGGRVKFWNEPVEIRYLLGGYSMLLDFVS